MKFDNELFDDGAKSEICKIQALEKYLATKLDSTIDVKPSLAMTMIMMLSDICHRIGLLSLMKN